MAKTTKKPENVAGLTARVEALERTVGLLTRTPAVAREFRLTELGERIRRIERRQDQAAEKARQAAAKDRAEIFRRFASERIVGYPGSMVTARALIAAYSRWTLDNGVPVLHRIESPGELLAAVTLAVPEAEAANVRPVGYLGRPSHTEPGFANIGLCEGETPEKVFDRLAHEAAVRDRDCRVDRELANAEHSWQPTQPPPSMR